ncbi:hypothetical protein DSM112329_03379 [Paraconexibacter sp. AEG42_29]|uniref:TerD family protein n=1 Tax=Paraconexibacter sp. AEG42_29 TaxID=2997339 RepID=A0AAU7AXX5_9ACTN
MESAGTIRRELIARTLRVPGVDGPDGDGRAAARQLDIALMAVNFKCSGELLTRLSRLHPVAVWDIGGGVLDAVRHVVGDHVRHNAYFLDFPANVPDTLDFWAACVVEALRDPYAAEPVAEQLAAGELNLLDLPSYGRYQHTYEELLAAHEPLIGAAADRKMVLGLGGPLGEESHALYLRLAGTPVPLFEADLPLLGVLAELHVGDAQPDAIPNRECRAVVNGVAMRHGLPLRVDTPVDVLRLACALSGGDVTLRARTRLRSFTRSERRALLAALDGVIAASPAKLADVGRRRERFKRLGERLHPHEYPRWPAAQAVFAVARGERVARSIGGRVEVALRAGEPSAAIAALAPAPGMLIRAVDRLARCGADHAELTAAVRVAAPDVATSVLLSLREHLLNRGAPLSARIFVNREGRAWVTPDERPPLPAALVAGLAAALDAELAGRLPRADRLVVDPAIRAVAVPLSDKTRPGGLGILPRGSILPATDLLRFFVYWKQTAIGTDFDLGVLLLDERFEAVGQVSWTNLTEDGAVHSGDVIEAPAGATEFIDLDLGRVDPRVAYVVPQVDVFSGEGFDQVEEAFFGFMQRTPEQQGRPFEPRTVRAKSDLYGAGAVALPLLFGRGPDGSWHAKWMHLNLEGEPQFNAVERNHLSTSLLVQGIAERRNLTVGHLADLMDTGAGTTDTAGLDPAQPVTYLGLERPDELPAGSRCFTPANLTELLSSA